MILIIVFSVDFNHRQWAISLRKGTEYVDPIILQHKRYIKSDHIFNFINSTSLKTRSFEFIGNNGSKKSRSTFSLPVIFINLVLTNPVIFAENFLHGLMSQDYHKRNIIICVSKESTNDANIVMDALKTDESYGKVFETNSDLNLVQQRIEAISEFQSSQADYILFLNNSVILEDKNVFRVMVAQNVSVIAPMIRSKNLHTAKWSPHCQHGFNSTGKMTYHFPDPDSNEDFASNREYELVSFFFL